MAAPKRQKRIRRAGKKTLHWEKTRKELKIRFERVGITTCEMRTIGCWIDNGLGFAHRLKRRNITTQDELERVALLCNSCHDKLEEGPEQRMADCIDVLIERRPVQP